MDYRRLFELFPYQQARFPQKAAIVTRQHRKWQPFSTSDCLERINQVSAGLLDLGLKKSDRIAIVAESGSPWWHFVDFGAQQIGVIPVPIHAASSTNDMRFILQDASINLVFCANEILYNKVLTAQPPNAPKLSCYCFEKINQIPHWESILRHPSTKHMATIEDRKRAIHDSDLATIIYTSGTSGQPKGVMLSHKNIISNIKSTIALLPINCDKTTFSFLPLSHVFERMVTYAYIAVGASIYYAESAEHLMKNIKEVRPHYFTAVPKVLEKMQAGIQRVANQKGGWPKRLINWSLQLGARFPDSGKMSLGYWAKHGLANMLVYRSWRQLLGGRVEGIVTGASALQPELGRLFAAAGIAVREGYGLTETSPVLAFNRFDPGGLHFGTVGIPIPGVRIKIDRPDETGAGEILAKGPNVMLGYFNNPAATQAVIDTEGWFHTGDVGLFVNKRFLKITGRKKDIFKTSAGKYIVPDLIANKIKASPYIEHCLVVGFHRPHVAALIVPNYPNLKQWCDDHNVHWTAPQYMAINPKVVQFVEGIVDDVNESLTNTEKVRKFTLLHDDWGPNTGELTPTLKLKREFVARKYEKEIEDLYN